MSSNDSKQSTLHEAVARAIWLAHSDAPDVRAASEVAATAAISVCMAEAGLAIQEENKDRGMFCTRWGVWLPSDGPYTEFFAAHNECPPLDHQRMLTLSSVLQTLKRLRDQP